MAVLAHTSTGEHIVLLAVAVAAVVGYGIGWARAGDIALFRLWCWVGGVAVLATAMSPWMETLAGRTFTGHMVQHLLLIIVVAPLVVVAEPVRMVRASWPRLRHSSSTTRVVTHRWHQWAPLIAPVLFVAVLFATHLTGMYDAALGNRLLHDAEHVAYLASAILLWVAVRGAGRVAAAGRVGLAFAVMAGSAVLGIVLLAASTPLYSTYVEQLGTDAALDDQRTAASLMWVGGMATTVPLLLIAVWRWAAAEERIAKRSEELASTTDHDRQRSVPPQSV